MNKKQTKRKGKVKMKATFLGPVGATFSHEAFDCLIDRFGEQFNLLNIQYDPASANSEVVPMILAHGGCGSVAMETKAQCRVSEALESFVGLLPQYDLVENCPINIVGAIAMKLNFCLMVRPSLDPKQIEEVIAHEKSIGACKGSIAKMMLSVAPPVSSNGEAARMVAEDADYANCAAIGPRSAAEKYGLEIINPEFQDREAVTTFYLIAPRDRQIIIGERNRLLIVFNVKHQPGSLIKPQMCLSEELLNMIQIHSVGTGDSTYDFAIEIEFGADQLESVYRAIKRFGEVCESHLTFGPFEVLSV